MEMHRELSFRILEMFNDVLTEKGITIPDNDNCTYFDLADKISALLAVYVDNNR